MVRRQVHVDDVSDFDQVVQEPSKLSRFHQQPLFFLFSFITAPIGPDLDAFGCACCLECRA
jgi:hypothetical protein